MSHGQTVRVERSDLHGSGERNEEQSRTNESFGRTMMRAKSVVVEKALLE